MSRQAGGSGPGGAVGHRERMRDHAVMIQKLLQDNRRISLARIAEEVGTSEMTVRRWIDCFSCVMPLRLERGIVIVEKWGPGGNR